MSKLNRIQNEIRQLEGGRFQNLCDVYLYRKRNWENITALGSMEGTDKTTKGIPDTYFFDEETNKYILVMYGTRKDSLTKLELDIKEAIEKTRIDKKDIQEIICCHTSSNLTVRRDKELRGSAGSIKVTILGIDTISHDLLQFKYQDIVKDFLSIAESTEQVWDIEQFISKHDKSKTNAPLTTSYIDEKNIVEELIGNLNDNQVLLLSGIPGTGKTRLAIELCKKLPVDSNIMCVKSNSLPVYQDIKDALDSSRINYLFLDDANTITNFDAIVNLLRLEEYEQGLKIIITVREYALSGIIDQLHSFDKKIYKIPVMSDDQIEMLINSIHDSLSTKSLRKVKNLARNNPRMTVIAATMLKANNYEFITNGKEILDSYYSQIIRDNALSQNEKKSLFILSFKQKLELTSRESMTDLLDFFKISFDSFLLALKQLHDKELCDIYQDKATKVSDQSLSDFVIIDFIANSKEFRVRDFFRELYPKCAKEIIDMIVRVTELNSSGDWLDYLTNEIKYVNNEIILEVEKEQFLIQFGVLIPIESLGYVYKKIQLAENVEFQVEQQEFEKKKKNNGVHDPIIHILCSLSNSEKFNDAGLMLMEYFQRKQDKIYEIFSAIKSNFNIENKWDYYFEKRLSIFETFSKQKNIDETIALLIANVAEEFLKYSGEYVTFNGKNAIFNRYTLVDGEYLIKLHTKILNVLAHIYGMNYVEVNNYIDKILFEYPVYEIENGLLETVTSDLDYIEKLFFKELENITIRQEGIVYKLKSEVEKFGLDIKLFTHYELSHRQNVYNIFSSNYFRYDIEKFDYDYAQKLRIDNLNELFKTYSNKLLWVFNTLAEYQSDKLLNKYELEESISLVYLEVNIENKVKILIELLNSNFTISYHFNWYMEKLSFVDGSTVLSNVKKEVDDRWYLSNMLMCKEINSTQIENMVSFITTLEDNEKISSFNIVSFENYINQDEIFLDIFWNKYEKSEISGEFFIPNFVSEDMAEKIIQLIGIGKAKEIYLNSLNTNKVDHSGKLFEKLIIVETDPKFIYSFLVELNNLRRNLVSFEHDIQFRYLWGVPYIEKTMELYMDFLIAEKKLIFIGIDPSLEKLFKADNKRFLNFFRNQILNTEDEERLVNLYNFALDVFNDEVLAGLFELIKDKYISEDFFRKLHLTLRSRTWSGSLVPLLDKEINFLNRLLDIFEETHYIPHALVITKNIDALKQQKEKELLSDYLK